MKCRFLVAPAVGAVLLAAFCLPVEASLSGSRHDMANENSASVPDTDDNVRGRSGGSTETSGSKPKASAKPNTKPSPTPSRATRYPGYYGPVGGPARKPAPVLFGIGGSW